jgi:hypothetical protein
MAPITDGPDGTQAGVFVLEAGLLLDPDIDPASVGAAVTTELCGHWEHEGPCHWPHNSAIDTVPEPALFRTVFVADPGDEPTVRKRIERSLQYGGGWHVRWLRSREVLDHEQALATRLAAGPRADEPLPRPD